MLMLLVQHLYTDPSSEYEFVYKCVIIVTVVKSIVIIIVPLRLVISFINYICLQDKCYGVLLFLFLISYE